MEETWKLFLLGILQGITEFLPISSSGHLAILENILLNVSKNSKLLIAIALHGGTLIALIYFFANDIISILKGTFKEIKQKELGKNLKLSLYIIISTIITGIIGLTLEKPIEDLFSSLTFIGIFFIINGINLIVANYIYQKFTNHRKDINLKDTIIITIGQCIALIPGISRSGSTIAFAFYRKIESYEAFKFSFYISILPILGANLLLGLKLIKHPITDIHWLPIIIGTTSSFLFGILSLYILRYFVKRIKLHIFGIYTIILGVIVLLWIS
jgi:undecaprenyl-diphosphatase